mmetsp:Transcript_44433/g.110073  ORF Transcript_44433/g.110073 Transcript_44433/m.110073 type:complete len:113 (-) Transcript_44433:61-399(-)
MASWGRLWGLLALAAQAGALARPRPVGSRAVGVRDYGALTPSRHDGSGGRAAGARAHVSMCELVTHYEEVTVKTCRYISLFDISQDVCTTPPCNPPLRLPVPRCRCIGPSWR